MARQSTSRLKFNPPLGRVPVLQYLPPAELAVDASYQRSIDAGDSQALIRRIATYWNWDLCQPLVVSRRRTETGDAYFVIDGQHRLAAAKLREDIGQLPCVVGEYGCAAEEAAAFVHLNQQRKPLKKLDLFKSAVASGDKEACAILGAITAAGLGLAPHTNYSSWKPGLVANVAGIEAAWRKYGHAAATSALRALAQAFGGEVLQYAGTFFPGIAAVCADEIRQAGMFEERRFERFQTMLVLKGQAGWRVEIHRRKGEEMALNYAAAAEIVLRAAWKAASENAAPPPPASRAARAPARPAATEAAASASVPAFAGSQWCDQCEGRKDHAGASRCSSRFCPFRKAA